MSFIGESQGFEQFFIVHEPPLNLKIMIPFYENVKSPVFLSLIREHVKQYAPTGKPIPDDPYMKVAIAKAAKAFKLPEHFKIFHLNDVFKKDLPIWSSSPGLPWMECGFKTTGQIRDSPNAIFSVRGFWRDIKRGEPIVSDDCCGFVCAKIQKDATFKCCAVWEYPATILLGEAVFALPLIEAYSKHDTPLAFGYDTEVGGMAKLVQVIKGKHYLRIHYKDFNKTVPEWIIRIAFDILFLNLDYINYQDFGVARFDYMMRMWDFIIDYFINTPVRLPNGERYRKKGGIVSSSYFNQLIGSIVNYILLTYASLKEGNELITCKVLGDDSISGFEKPIYPGDIRRHVEPLGFTLDSEKSGSSPYISDLCFLGFQINDKFPNEEES